MVYRFLACKLDTERRELRGDRVPVAIPPNIFSLLVHLVERSDRMVSKAELLDGQWPPNASEDSLQTAIGQIRKLLDDDPRSPTIVSTHHGRGFRFIADLPIAPGDHLAAAKPAPPALALRETRLAAVLCVRIEGAAAQDVRPGILEDAHSTARAIVETHQGRLLHMMVDGFTAVFGLDLPTDDAARQAVYCAADLAARALAALGAAPAFAVETGPL